VVTRNLVIVVAMGALVLAACAAPEGVEQQDLVTMTSTTTTTPAVGEPAVGILPEGPSALDNMTDSAFPEPLVDPRDIISGGPPPDGIPSIDTPVFIDVVDNLDALPANEPVVLLEINGDARAYPVRVMIWHEIVNDVVGGVPVAVTYCPLCNSAATYDRRVRAFQTTFGTSGRLFASALVMYDRATESLWTHYNGEAVVGLLAGERLTEYASPLLSWGEFRSSHPNGRLLDFTQTGFNRDYGRNPYVGYDDPEGTPFLFRGALDDRATALARVVGVDVDGSSAAFPLSSLRAEAAAATNTGVGASPIVILWKAGQASALDSGSIEDGVDVGSTGVFRPIADGQSLTFVAEGGAFVDLETGSTWTITGHATAGSLEGSQLERIPHLDTFWFAWSTYQPGTVLVEG